MGILLNFWEKMAPRWDRIAPPFRPNEQDQEYMNTVLQDWNTSNGPPRAVVFGVTPEMAHLKWPSGTDLLAVDNSRGMIDHVWPGFPEPGEGVLHANWFSPPLEPQSRDILLSDGPFGPLRYPNEHQHLLRSVRRILQPKGLFAFRVFIQAETREEPAAVYDAALSGEMSNFHTFKFRLWMALQSNTQSGARMGDVWTSWQKDGPSAERLSKQSGWPVEQIRTINIYRDKDFVITCPKIEELQYLLHEAGFEEVDHRRPTYEMGDRFPTLVYRKGEK